MLRIMDDKPIKISHSRINEYISCSQRYKYKYVDKLQPISKNASLFFGSAIDLAIQSYLKDPQSDYMKVFETNWKRGHNSNNRWIWLYNSLEIDYSYRDYDPDLLTKEDEIKANDALKELNPGYTGTFQDYMEEVTNNKKQRAYRHFSDNEKRYFNRLSWLSMNRKGQLMIKAFIDDIAPKIDKVLMVQKRIDLKSNNGDALTGYVDMVLDIKEMGTIIFDLKTASMPYENLETMISQQLGIYAAVLGPEINSYKVGYIVLLKNIKKEKIKTCKSCHFRGEGSHKTCNNLIYDKKGSKVRCNGGWEITINAKAETQMLVDELSESNRDAILNTVGEVTHAIKEGIFFRNSQSCLSYGGCPYLDYCYKGKMDGLKKDES
jgi:hypothetical protein